jgi:uncharacterized protein YjbI with pentapeptide repeats
LLVVSSAFVACYFLRRKRRVISCAGSGGLFLAQEAAGALGSGLLVEVEFQRRHVLVEHRREITRALAGDPLPGAALPGAVLSGAVLSWTVFSWAVFSWAVFSWAVFSWAVFSWAAF